MTRLKSVALALPIFLTICACSKGEETASTYNSENTPDSAAPDIGLTSAPGVAFSYDYRFGLESGKIATLQERHAAACEALGIDKCRITGLSFSRRGADTADGSLELALAPDLARKFGRDAIAAVEAAKGTVAAIDIKGENKNPTLEKSTNDINAARAEHTRLEAQLSQGKLSDATRVELLRQIAGQKAAELEAQSQGETARKTLVTTPMRFIYSTNGFLPGISLDRTAWSALSFAGVLLNGLFALIVVLAALAIPVGLLLLGFAHSRKVTQRIWRWLAPSSEPELG